MESTQKKAFDDLSSVKPDARSGKSSFYKALPAPRSIRLLQFDRIREPLSSNPTITLYPFKLERAPPFRALSYTWDDPYQDPYETYSESTTEHVATIKCNGADMKVTQNLFDALQSLREIGTRGLLWVDAISINQEDLVEKSAQILLMGDIYSSAKEVIAWLGPYRLGILDFKWAATEFLDVIQSSTSPIEAKAVFSPSNILEKNFWYGLGMEPPGSRLMSVCKFYASCRWFTRLWVLQEVVLAKSIRILCGSTEVDFMGAMHFAFITRSLGWQQDIAACLSGVDNNILLDWLYELNLHCILRRDVRLSRLTNGQDEDWRDLANPLPYLDFMLEFSSSFDCSNESDNIYAVISLVSKKYPDLQISNWIQPDYDNTTPEQLFTNVDTMLLKNSKYLQRIGHTGRGNESKSTLKIPSWVHDYSSHNHSLSGEGNPLFKISRDFNAALCKASHSPRFEILRDSIVCHGSKFEDINRIQESSLDDSLAFLLAEPIQKFFQFYLESAMESLGSLRLEIFAKAMILDLVEQRYGVENPLDAGFKAFIKCCLLSMLMAARNEGVGIRTCSRIIETLESKGSPDEQALVHDICRDKLCVKNEGIYVPCTPSDEWATILMGMHSDAAQYERNMSTAVKGRRLFRTERGFLGLGPNNMEEGDEVWLLTDARTPMILRSVSGSFFTVVGECYLHGFMHGEMLDDQWGLKENISQIRII